MPSKIFLIAFLVFYFDFSLNAQPYFQNNFPQVWERTTSYTQEVAEKMPEEHYNFRPTGESMSFKEQVLHLVDNIAYLTGQITAEKKIFYEGKKDELGKKQILEILKRSNQYVLQLIKKMEKEDLRENILFAGIEMAKENIFYLIRDHQAHHRGQCVVYLRMKGISPPNYVGW